MFTILIGSVAKMQHRLNSDIDIVRIGHEELINRKREWPNGPISYIDYSFDDFIKLYNSGSLFIYHVVKEGILLYGCDSKWKEYVDNFRFIDAYEEELYLIRDLFFSISNITIYGGTYLSFYSNLFTMMKNFSIFYLAHSGIFDFNKESSFKRIFDNKYFEILNSAYNIFERNDMELVNTFNYKSDSLTQDIVEYFTKKLEVLI